MSENPFTLTKSKVSTMLGIKEGTMSIPGLECQIDEINRIGFDTKYIRSSTSTDGIMLEYNNHSNGDSITYLGENAIEIHIDSLFDEDRTLVVDRFEDLIAVALTRPIDLTPTQIEMINNFGGAFVKANILFIGRNDNSRALNELNISEINNKIIDTAEVKL